MDPEIQELVKLDPIESFMSTGEEDYWLGVAEDSAWDEIYETNE